MPAPITPTRLAPPAGICPTPDFRRESVSLGSLQRLRTADCAVSRRMEPGSETRMTNWRTRISAGCLIAAVAIGCVGAPSAQTLRIGLAEDPDVLDPTLARTYVGRIVFAALCDKLVDIGPEL